MSIKLKALGLGLLAAMAMSAVAVMNAGAETGGHFVSSASHTNLIGEESGTNHRVKFASDGGTPIECTKATYTGTMSGSTATEVSIKPHYTECRTEDAPVNEHKVVVHMNGCEYNFTVGQNPEGHNTVHLVCPTGVSGATITHPNCTMRMPAQTPADGVAYTSDTSGPAHAITADVTATGITAHYEGGICVFLGTKHTATMTGSVTLRGEDTNGNPASITATG